LGFGTWNLKFPIRTAKRLHVDLSKIACAKLVADRSSRRMNTAPRSPNRGRTFIAALLAIGFLWTLAVSVSPQLHARVHPDANRTGHTCAVTMIASGNYNYSAQTPLISAPVPAVQFSKIPALTPHWVESPFLGASVFEHAPPVRA
jgi:hypothetical protein